MIKMLHLDIETSPNTAHVWGLWKQNVSISQLMESSYTLCWSAKWHHERSVLYKRNTTANFLEDLWALLDEADVVVHYNGKKFDIPTVNKEFALNSMAPPSPYKQIDLLQVVRNKFRFPSNKLDYVAQQFGLGEKHTHEGHALWVKCMNNDPASWKVMEKYNKQDVRLLEKLYDKILPWIDNHPNVGLYIDPDKPMCPSCGSYKIHKRGFAKTTTQIYQRYQCTDCKSWIRGRQSQVPQEKSRHILTHDRL